MIDGNTWAMNQYLRDIDIKEKLMDRLDGALQLDILEISKHIDGMYATIRNFSDDYNLYLDEYEIVEEYIKDLL